MAQVQNQFEEFNERIMLKRFKENKILREKRDIIRSKLKEQLPGIFDENNEDCPDFYFRDQGSYEMGTGVKPIDGDYDIDQGLYFKVSTTTYPDPVVLKERVHKALDGHTEDVRIRRPCVTVFYQREGEPIYHVDIAVYSDSSKNSDGKSRLAKGREHSTEEYRIWEVSEPQTLTDAIYSRFEGNDRAQFRRTVRYLKRWKDEKFPSDGNTAPIGIGITVAAYDELQPTYADIVAGKPDDLLALCKLIEAILNRFAPVWDEDDQKWIKRLEVTLPIEPWSDLFEQMTNKQMVELEAKLITLLEALNVAIEDVDPVEACKNLQKVFGDDFPVPEKEETGKKHAPAIVSSSSSA